MYTELLPMLTIRDSQMKAFEDFARRNFEQRLIRHLAETIGISLDRLRTEIPAALPSAQELGFSRECDVARYCELVYKKAGIPALDALPKEARNILLAYGVPPAEKLDQLERWTAVTSSGAE